MWQIQKWEILIFSVWFHHFTTLKISMLVVSRWAIRCMPTIDLCRLSILPQAQRNRYRSLILGLIICTWTKVREVSKCAKGHCTIEADYAIPIADRKNSTSRCANSTFLFIPWIRFKQHHVLLNSLISMGNLWMEAWRHIFKTQILSWQVRWCADRSKVPSHGKIILKAGIKLWQRKDKANLTRSREALLRNL